MPREKNKKAPTQGSHAGGTEGLSAGDASSDRQPAPGGKKSTPEDQQAAPCGKQSAPGDRHPTSGGKQYTPGNQKLTPGGQKPNPGKGASNKRAAPRPWKEVSAGLLENSEFLYAIREHIERDHVTGLTASRRQERLVSFVDQAAKHSGVIEPITINGIEMEKVVDYFGLDHRWSYLPDPRYLFDITSLVPKTEVTTSESLLLFLASYQETFIQRTEAACRPAIDLVLIHTFLALKGITTEQPHGLEASRSKLRVGAEVHIRYVDEENCRSYDGRLDYGVMLRKLTANSATHYLSCMVVAEAKRMGLANQAIGQLLCYLACIRASRIKMGKNRLPLYGVASDGREYKFVVLEPGGRVRASNMLSINEHLEIILKTIVYIIERSFEPPADGDDYVDELEVMGDDTDDQGPETE